MRKLLSASFARLRRESAYWVLLCGVFLIAVIVSIPASRAFHAAVEHGCLPSLEDYYFQLVPALGAVFAVFISLFLGTEYADGTIRNKLTIGHGRGDLYAANVLSAFAACLSFTAAYFVGGLPGLVLIGPFAMGWSGYFTYAAAAVGVTAAFSALFTWIAMTSSNRTMTLVYNLGLWLGMAFVASGIYDRLSEPELASGLSYFSGQLVMQDAAPNPLYVAGNLRVALECLLELLPTGQLMLMCDVLLEHPLRGVLFSVLLTAVSIVLGMWCFQKKDIK